MDAREALEHARAALSRTEKDAPVALDADDVRVLCDALEALQSRGRLLPDRYEVLYDREKAFMVTAVAMKETGEDDQEIALRLTRRKDMDDETLGEVKN